MARLILPALAALTVMAQVCTAQASPTNREGTVRFSTSCRPAVRPQFNHAIALVHSFAFSQASRELTDILRADPDCAMAYWARALSAWGNPFAPGIRSQAQVEQGLGAIRQARRTGHPSAREQGYIEALAHLYQDAATRSQAERLLDYQSAMAALSLRQPADTEARIFYALALDISADPADKSYHNQLAAAAILEPLFKALPRHPGLAHYLIHTYDVPALAVRGIRAADQYSRIAPAVSHALHMPSHVFTRVGMWRESIDANAAAAARAHQEGSIAEELHAMDYGTYAFLQSGLDTAAASLLSKLPALAQALDPNLQTTGAPPAAGYFALAAIPARFALERGQWAEAARLTPTASPVPYAEALTAFARALGGARSGDTSTAAAGLMELQRLRDLLASRHEAYWVEQLEIEYLSASAWLRLASGDTAQAVATMTAAAGREEATEKSVISPGPLAPARELLGEMLLSLGRPAEALPAFEQSLGHDPGRLRSLVGAFAAAKASGQDTRSLEYRRQLAAICGSPPPPTPREPPIGAVCRSER